MKHCKKYTTRTKLPAIREVLLTYVSPLASSGTLCRVVISITEPVLPIKPIYEDKPRYSSYQWRLGEYHKDICDNKATLWIECYEDSDNTKLEWFLEHID